MDCEYNFKIPMKDLGGEQEKITFNPMTDVPTTDEEVMIALERGDAFLTSILQGIYQARRVQGDSVLDAYQATLEAHINAGKVA